MTDDGLDGGVPECGGATIAYAVVATFAIVKLVDVILGIRVSARDEEMGIDLAIHGEIAYQA